MLTGLLVAVAENLPLGVMQIVYSQRVASHLALLDMLSLVTSWFVVFGHDHDKDDGGGGGHHHNHNHRHNQQ